MDNTAIREALKAAKARGIVWSDVLDVITAIAGRRVVGYQALLRFVHEQGTTRATTVYWLERAVKHPKIAGPRHAA